MKILVMSDSHGKRQYVLDAIYDNKDADAVIHLGDGVRDFDTAVKEARELGVLNTDKIYKVKGNCDMFLDEAVTLFEDIGGYKFYITHGYEQRVKSGPEYLLKDAKENGRNVALYGHTHRQFYEERLGVHIFNPGALNYGDYGIITIDDATGEITFEHKEL